MYIRCRFSDQTRAIDSLIRIHIGQVNGAVAAPLLLKKALSMEGNESYDSRPCERGCFLVPHSPVHAHDDKCTTEKQAITKQRQLKF